MELTGFARSYAALVFRNQGRVVVVNRQLRVRGDLGQQLPRPGRGPAYDAETVKVLVQARTPYQRLLDSRFIKAETKRQLRERYRLLNPAQLKRLIEGLQRKLLATAVSTALTRKGQSAKRSVA